MKKINHIIIDHIKILLLGIVLGLFALILVHLLPTEPIKENILKSMYMIEKEFADNDLISGNHASLTGSFTDCLMLQYAAYTNEEHGLLEQVLLMYRSETCYEENFPDGWWPGYSLRDYLTGVEQPREVKYARYWHGYLVILKPLLLFADFDDIRLINSTLQLVLTGAIIIILERKNAHLLAKSWLVSLPFMYFFSTFASLSLSVCFYIMHAAVLVQMFMDEKLYHKNRYYEFFLVLGIVTAYFDLLTYPLVVLGYPLCVYFYFHWEDFKLNLRKLVAFSLEWVVGYGVMWASKWVIADVVTGEAIIEKALKAILERSDSAKTAGRMDGFVQVLICNVKAYSNWSFLLFVVAVVGVLLYMCIKARKVILQNLSGAAIYFVIAVFPFVWYFVMQNHSEEHWQFTCRILALTVFAGVTGAMKLCENKHNL